MNATIQDNLSRIEREYGVKILWACESGSRAWGFPSPDSDYDVRFIYAHDPAHYLRVFDKRDVIEEPVSGVLDISGWDIKKALGLLRKSNPALREWLSSPIVYQRDAAGMAPLLSLVDEAFLPLASCHHYLSHARDDIRKLAEDRDLRLKKYLYMFRALLAAQWVTTTGGQPPMRFQDLLEAFLPSGDIREQVDELLEMKSRVQESEMIPPQPDLDDYLLRLYGRLEASLPQPLTPPAVERFDECLRKTLRVVWPGWAL
jgi:predicted nucleotidyltransferase